MIEAWLSGGVFSWLIGAFALAALVFNLRALRRSRAADAQLALALIGATLCMALSGYGIGMYQAAMAFDARPELLARASVAEGIAASVLFWGGAACAVNGVLWSIGRYRWAGAAAAAR